MAFCFVFLYTKNLQPRQMVPIAVTQEEGKRVTTIVLEK